MLFAMEWKSALRQHHIIGGSLVLAFTQLLASVAGLARDRVLASTFPGLSVVDVYIASFRPSDFLFQTCIMAAMGTVLVPVLAGYRAHDDRASMSKVLSGAMTIGAIGFGIIALLLAIFLPFIAHLLVDFQGQSLSLYIQFGRIALISNFLFVFGNTLGQYLITEQRYWIYGLTPVLYTLGTIAGTIWLTPYTGAFGPILGTVCGTSIYVLIRLAGVLHLRWKPSFTLWHPEFPQMGMLMLPRILSLGAMQLQLLAFDGLASGLLPGSVTVNAYARNFQSVLVGVTGVALAQSVYSVLGQAAARGNRVLFRKYLRWGIGMLLLVTIPGAIVLAALAPVAAMIVGITSQLSVFAPALVLYAASVPFESMNHVLLRGFYATKQTLIPAIAAAANALCAIGVAVAFAKTDGVLALAGGFLAGQTAQMLLLALLLPAALRKVKPREATA